MRCAVWLGMNLALRGEIGPATGWLGRAQRLLENEGDCAERGYLLLPVVFQHEAAGDFAAAAAAAGARPSRSASASATATSSRSPSTGRATC